MITFKQHINELFTSPYKMGPLRQVMTGKYSCKFETDSGLKYTVIFNVISPEANSWDLHFTDQDGGVKLNGLGGKEVVRIITTVIEIIKKFIDEIKPSLIVFDADKSETSRVSLYDRIMKKIDVDGYTNIVPENDEGYGHYKNYQIKKKKINILDEAEYITINIAYNGEIPGSSITFDSFLKTAANIANYNKTLELPYSLLGVFIRPIIAEFLKDVWNTGKVNVNLKDDVRTSIINIVKQSMSGNDLGIRKYFFIFTNDSGNKLFSLDEENIKFYRKDGDVFETTWYEISSLRGDSVDEWMNKFQNWKDNNSDGDK